MAQVVLGIGTSHTPQLSSGADNWALHAERDARTKSYVGPDGNDTTFEESVAHADPKIAPQLSMDVWKEKDTRANGHLDTLGKYLQDADLDVLVIVGDDQRELFGPKGNPALGLFLGDELWDLGNTEESLAKTPPDIRLSRWATHADHPDAYQMPTGLTRNLAEALIDDDFDVTVFSEQQEGLSLGHAFTFLRLRLGLPAKVKILPVFLNTFYPPNVMSPRRCWALGAALRRAVEAWPADLRVGFAASGGLSHTMINEDFDRQVIAAMAGHDGDAVAAIPKKFFRAGNSECLNWLVVGGAMHDARMDVLDYIPAYRSPAGTGTAMTFARWTPEGQAA
jgi:Catalytic LigB subunit of aromatic ring-opening dioxygenase